MEEREQRALRIFREALDTDPSVREDFMSERCAGDEQLRDRVASLLRAIAVDGLDESEEIAGGAEDALVGSVLGTFRVVERIGRGGMGVVYRGVREGADFHQDVAIKLIRRGFDFDDIRARFLRERRILARLSHPNLARFIDGGQAPDGRPWFALEFVQGLSITRWCDARRLDIRSRVSLFLEVCAAVQYAHTQLVVHRDLKPGNIMVDESGTVRLLDFGVAGLLAGNPDRDASTMGQPLAMTREYAAPEQFAGSAVGVATDVYSLGVTLYELIAGVLPYAGDRGDASAGVRIARDVTPPSLASAIGRSPAGPSDPGDSTRAPADAIAGERTALRRTHPRAFRRLVHGDLSRIVDKALVADPARRYATVAAFADDLASWLAGAPVRVTGNGVGYRIGKFVSRHRAAVASLALALVLSIAFGVYHLYTLGSELRRTQTQRNRAEASLDFLQKLLASPDPQMGLGTDAKLGDFLKNAAGTIARTSGLDPEIRNELGVTIAGSLKSIDRYDEALAIVRPIAATSADTPAGWVTRVQASTLAGEILTLGGDYPQALAQLSSAQALADAHAVVDPLTIATLLSTRSIAHNHLGQWEDSVRLIDRAVDIARPLGERSPEFVANLIGFSSIPRAYPKTDLPKAEALLRESLAFQESHGLKTSGLYPNTLGELAQTLIDQGLFEDAEPMLLDAAAQMKARFGADHRETSFKLNDLALLYFRWNRFDDARRWRDDATRAMSTALGNTHPFVALSLIQSADLAFYAGDFTRAATDAASSVPIADPADREEFTQRAQLYAAASRCAGGETAAADILLARVAALKDTFGVRAFDVRLAAADCLGKLARRDEARAAIEPFAAKLASGAPLSRNDYIAPAIARVTRGDAATAPGSPAHRP